MDDVQTTALAAITVRPELQPRTAGLDNDHVHALADTPDSWPPLRVVRDGAALVLVDGFHRFAAAQNLDRDMIEVEIVPPPEDGDLRGLAFRLNVGHGRPLTLTDRRTEARRLLGRMPDLSDREIARRCVLAPTTIGTLRREQVAVQNGQLDRPASGARSSRSPTQETIEHHHGPGELPPPNVITGEDYSISSAERRQQRQIAGYFKRLAVSLDEMPAFGGADETATACRVVLGSEQAAALAGRLGDAARDVLAVACALGYPDTSQPVAAGVAHGVALSEGAA